MSRQNLKQSSGYPWVAHGCFEGASGFATDALQLLGPPYRASDEIDPGLDLPSERLQHEVACPMIQSPTVALEPDENVWVEFDQQRLHLFDGASRMALSAVGMRLITSRLYGLAPTDPVAFAAAIAVLAAVALIATCLPAYRASRVDPLVALRHE